MGNSVSMYARRMPSGRDVGIIVLAHNPTSQIFPSSEVRTTTTYPLACLLWVLPQVSVSGLVSSSNPVSSSFRTQSQLLHQKGEARPINPCPDNHSKVGYSSVEYLSLILGADVDPEKKAIEE